MSQFEKSEIMVRYAEILGQKNSPIKKESVDSEDFGFFAAEAVGGGAAGYIASALGLGLAASFGAAVAGAIILGGAGSLLMNYMSQSNADITNLIEQINSLSYEGTDAEGAVERWKSALKRLKVELGGSFSGRNNKETLSLLEGMVKRYINGLSELNRIKDDFLFWKNQGEFRDWFGSWGDIGDVETAINNSIEKYSARLADLKARVKEVSSKIEAAPEGIAQEILSIDAEIKRLLGYGVKYTKFEKSALAWAQGKMQSGKLLDEQTQNKYQVGLAKLLNDMKTKILPEAKSRAAKKKAGTSKPISKRAVSLPSPSDSGSAGNSARKPSGKGSKWVPLDTVKTMQRQINNLSVALDVDIGGRLRDDGLYGPATAKALVKLIGAFSTQDAEKYPERANLASELKKEGLSINEISNYDLIRKDTYYINRITNAISDVWDYHINNRQRNLQNQNQGAGEAEQSKQQQKKPMPAPKNINDAPCKRRDPSPEQMIACFKTLQTSRHGRLDNLYQIATHEIGMNNQDIINMLKSLFGNMAPSSWNVAQIMDAMPARSTGIK